MCYYWQAHLIYFMETLKSHAASQNLWSNAKQGAESPYLLSKYVLHPSPSCSVSKKLTSVLCVLDSAWVWLIKRHQQPIGRGKERVIRVFFSLEVLPSRCRLTVARFLYLSRKILPGPPQLQLQLSLDSGNHSFLLPEQTYRSPVVVSLADYLNSAHILQIVDSLNEPNYQSRECHLFPSRTLSDTINKAEYHFRKNKYFLHCLLPVKLSRPLYILFQFIRWKQLF